VPAGKVVSCIAVSHSSCQSLNWQHPADPQDASSVKDGDNPLVELQAEQLVFAISVVFAAHQLALAVPAMRRTTSHPCWAGNCAALHAACWSLCTARLTLVTAP
jgi:hypothetical protein